MHRHYFRPRAVARILLLLLLTVTFLSSNNVCQGAWTIPRPVDVVLLPRYCNSCHRSRALITYPSILILGAHPSQDDGSTSGGSGGSSGPPKSVIGGSFVEGNVYDSTADEIEAMGGDPFFLGDYDRDRDSTDVDDAVDDDDWNGVSEGWDGVVDDNAHFDFD